MIKPVRRIVTGHDENGRSIFVADDIATSVYSPKGQPNVGMTDLWLQHSAPADNTGNDDTAPNSVTLLPPTRGSVCRVVEFPPDSERNFAAMQDHFSGMGAGDNLAKDKPRHAAFHKTDSLDYIFILEGEIWALVDESEVLMRPGDCLIQRGTSHAWSNRSDKPCLMAAILIDADPAP
ncbi:MAG: cupin domain-containing protein [Pseudomonadota bacterium]|nr:cupin domain-containing protein [Pseudomonadota bacterium]